MSQMPSLLTETNGREAYTSQGEKNADLSKSCSLRTRSGGNMMCRDQENNHVIMFPCKLLLPVRSSESPCTESDPGLP